MDDRVIRAAWNSPDDTGGATITGYLVEITEPDQVRLIKTAGTSLDIPGLVNGATYSIRVAATNIAGTGVWSEAIGGLLPRTIPDAPTKLRISAGDRTVTLGWTPPEDDGGGRITGYVVEITSGAGTALYSALDPTLIVLQLVNETSYAVRVAAVNAAGQGSWTPMARFRPRAPRVTAPTDVRVDVRGEVALVTWQPPTVGEPLRYVVSVSVNGKSFRSAGSTTSRRLDISLRGRGSMSVRVAAVDTRGRGPWNSVTTSKPSAGD